MWVIEIQEILLLDEYTFKSLNHKTENLLSDLEEYKKKVMHKIKYTVTNH